MISDCQSAVSTVWIVGSSIVYWAETRAKVSKMQNLLYDPKEVRVYWDGVRGMKWDALMINLQRDLAVYDFPEPDVLIIHLGSNDVASWNTDELISRMKADIQKVREMFPLTQLVFSEILARRVWRGLSLECGEAKRQRINQEVGQYVTEIGGVVVPHENILHQNVTLYIKDGVHMNDFGNDILLDDIMNCLSSILAESTNDTEDSMETEDEVILSSIDLDICYTLPLSEVNKDIEGNYPQQKEINNDDDFEIEFKTSE